MREDLYEIIPFAKEFSINRLGMIKGPTGLKKHYRNGNGYPTVGIKLNDGRFTTMGVHRLLATVFLNPPQNYEELHVNHIDSNKDNFSLNNLEWVLPTENNIHAALSSKLTKPKIISIDPTGEQKLHLNLEDVANYLSCTNSEVWVALNNGIKLKGHELKLRGKHLPASLKKITYHKIMTKRKLKVIDLETDEISHYNSLNECAKSLGVVSSCIHSRISDSNTVKLLKSRWLILDECSELPDLEKHDIQRKSGKKDVVALNITNKELWIYSSATEFWYENNLSKKAVTIALKRDVIREVGGWIFLYLTSKNIERISLYVKCPDLHT